MPTPSTSHTAQPQAPAPSNAIRVGYARISTRGQDHATQLELLNAADCREVVEETISTRRKDRPKLYAVLAGMKAADTLVITKPDRVARSVKELLVFLEDELAPRGINLHILTGICAGIHRPNGQSIGDKMLFLVAAMAAEMERDLISERTQEGLDAARAAGRAGGRPAKVTDDVLAAARARRRRGQSVSQIARELGVGRSTLYRALENDDLPVTPLTSGPLGKVPGLRTEEKTPMDGGIDRVAVALLRKLKPEVQQFFLDNEEFRSLPDAERNRLYELDAEIAEAERQRARRGKEHAHDHQDPGVVLRSPMQPRLLRRSPGPLPSPGRPCGAVQG